MLLDRYRYASFHISATHCLPPTATKLSSYEEEAKGNLPLQPWLGWQLSLCITDLEPSSDFAGTILEELHIGMPYQLSKFHMVLII